MKKVFTWVVVLMLSLASFGGSLKSDINNDGRVDLSDFILLSEEWLMADNCIKFPHATTYGYISTGATGVLVFQGDGIGFSYWFYVPTNVSGPVLDLSDNDLGTSFILESAPANGKPKLTLSSDTARVIVSAESSAAINYDAWNFVMVAISATTEDIKMYLNGALVCTEASTDTAMLIAIESGQGPFANSMAVLFGRQGVMVDDLRFYTTGDGLPVLADYSDIYNDGLGTKYTGELGEHSATIALNMDDGSGSTITNTGTETSEVGNLVGAYEWFADGTPFEAEPEAPAEPITQLPFNDNSLVGASNQMEENSIV